MNQASVRSESAVTRTPLPLWTLSMGATRDTAPAEAIESFLGGVAVTVPCSVLSTLVERGLVRDVTVNGTEQEAAWHSDCSWHFTTSVPRQQDGAHVRLVFMGVDTVATIRVDGHQRVVTDDMFHRWSVDLGIDDREGAWEVDVELAPVLPIARAAEEAQPLPRAEMYELPYNQVRKMACSFGWDWGPTTVTCGLWRDVVLERRGASAIGDCYVSGDWDGRAVLRGNVRIDGPASSLHVRVTDDDGAPVGSSIIELAHGQATFEFPVRGARRWDVRSRGDQPVYTAHVDLVDSAGAIADTVERRVGFRRIELTQRPDDHGREFSVHVNGQRVWARGFNWIPADVLPERVTREHMKSLLMDVAATGANMLRVWGGGVIESDDFYETCDELGLLVWQDFSFACAAYAEDDAQAQRVTREVADAVERVGHHPSLALWCGCNENLWGHEDWGWKKALGDEGAWGARLYYEVIPEALTAIDPARPYIPGSPFSPDRGDHPNDPRSGTTHHWDTWNELDYTAFLTKSSRFASEFGWQAPCAWPTLVEALGGAPSGAADERIARIQKAYQGMESLQRGLDDHLSHLPPDGPHWHAAAQIVQARALSTSIGRFRSMHDTCSGALWWQFDDCWPALSWSVVDVAGRRKLAWYAAREVMADRAILPMAEGPIEGFTLVNDTPRPWTVALDLRSINGSGAALGEVTEITVTVPADSHVIVEHRAASGAVATVADAEGIRAARWIGGHLDAATSPSRVIVTVGEPRGNPESATVRVEAIDLVRDLSLLADRLPGLANAVVDRQLRLLLPGETATFVVTARGARKVGATEWGSVLAASTIVEAAGEAS